MHACNAAYIQSACLSHRPVLMVGVSWTQKSRRISATQPIWQLSGCHKDYTIDEGITCYQLHQGEGLRESVLPGLMKASPELGTAQKVPLGHYRGADDRRHLQSPGRSQP